MKSQKNSNDFTAVKNRTYIAWACFRYATPEMLQLAVAEVPVCSQNVGTEQPGLTDTQTNCSSADDAQNYMSLVVRKPVFGVSDQVPHKPGNAVTEDG